jgi:UDP-N-acetylmuramate--alanine ligase
MFLGLQPKVAVVTNVEHDHPDCFPTPEDYYQAFLEFARQVLPDGVLLACGVDAGAARLLGETGGRDFRRLAYALGATHYDYYARDLRPNAVGGYTFEVVCGGMLAKTDVLCPAVRLQVPGQHNVLNALASLAVAHQLELPIHQASQALEAFQGTGRRFEVCGELQGVAVIDDYGHHPSEIRATLSAARIRYPGRRLWAVWQPHTYSRTRALLDAFATAFDQADCIVVTEVYPAREPAPADGFSAQQVVQAMRHPEAHFVPGLAKATAYLLERLQKGDVLLVFSAGDADRISANVLAALEERRQSYARD